MKTRTIKFIALISFGCLLLSSCEDKYGDQLRDVGARVEYLEDHIPQINADIAALWQLIKTIEENGYVTEVVKNNDGTTTIRFNDGHTVTVRNGKDGSDGTDGQDGQDGQEATLIIGVWKDVDGSDGADGSDGLNGRKGRDGVVPQMRINDNGTWEISTDGGKTWEDTGIGANGKDGRDGRADIFSFVGISEDGQYLIVRLADGSETFYVPIITQ